MGALTCAQANFWRLCALLGCARASRHGVSLNVLPVTIAGLVMGDCSSVLEGFLK